MKQLKSFRLDQQTLKELEFLSNHLDKSQANIIESLINNLIYSISLKEKKQNSDFAFKSLVDTYYNRLQSIKDMQKKSGVD